jgi:hypothetical protein
VNKTQTFAPTGAGDVKRAGYEALKLTNEEYLKLLSCGHPGATVSVAQAGAQFVVAGTDMRQLREAYSDADAATLVTNSKLRVVKPE